MTAVTEPHRIGVAPMLLSLRLTQAERQAIGYHLTGKPIAVGNRVASRFLHDELRRTLKGVVVEYEGDRDAMLFVGKEGSSVWHIAQGEPTRGNDGWRCAVACSSRLASFDHATLDPQEGDERRLCRSCVKANSEG